MTPLETGYFSSPLPNHSSKSVQHACLAAFRAFSSGERTLKVLRLFTERGFEEGGGARGAGARLLSEPLIFLFAILRGLATTSVLASLAALALFLLSVRSMLAREGTGSWNCAACTSRCRILWGHSSKPRPWRFSLESYTGLYSETSTP